MYKHNGQATPLVPSHTSLAIILTSRLILRPLQEHDRYDIMTYATDSKVNRFIQWPSHIGSLRLGIEYHKQIIGECGLIFHTQTTEIYYVLAKKYWGFGFATEAATALISYGSTTLGIQRIEAWIVELNKKSLCVAARLAMHHTMTLEKQWSYNGRYYDVLIYTLNQ